MKIIKSLVISIKWAIFFCFSITIFNGCSLDNSTPSNLAKADWIRSNEREFVTVWSVNDIPFVEVTLQYIGKNPTLPHDGVLPDYEWKKKNTDFYNCSLRNLLDVPIDLVEVHFELEKGKWQSQNPQGTEHISKRWGSHVIPPNETILRKNSWVWGKGSENTLQKTYTAQITPPSHDPKLQSLFEENNDLPISFSFSCPLKFIR